MTDNSISDREIRRRYLEALGVPSMRALGDSIAASILSSIPGGVPQSGPVRLSRAAEQLLIERTPKFSAAVREGEIAFDPARNRFVITLNARYEDAWHVARTNSALGERASPVLTRGRFTYAHEVAHRFCFVLGEERWERAISVVSAGLALSARIRAQRLLTAIEERVCNNAAGKILIPDGILRDRIGSSIPNEAFSDGQSFYSNLLSVSEELLVSRECLLRRIRSSLDEGAMSIAGDFCALLVAYSDRTPKGRSHVRPRIKVAITSSCVQERTGVLAGLDIESCGSEAMQILGPLLEGVVRKRHGKVDVPLLLPSAPLLPRPRCLRAALSGWWQTLGPATESRAAEVLLWGTLQVQNCAASGA